MKTLKVLIIEDNPADVELVGEALKSVDIEASLHLATDFEEAKQKIDQIRVAEDAPQVVLLDLNLPKGSGLDLLRILRMHPVFEKVPVIVVSSSSAPRDKETAAQLGAASYFRKPANLEEFMKLGQVVLDSLQL